MLNLVLRLKLEFVYYSFFRICPIFQISNVTGLNLDLLKEFLNLLSVRGQYQLGKPPIFQIDDTYSVAVSFYFQILQYCSFGFFEGY